MYYPIGQIPLPRYTQQDIKFAALQAEYALAHWCSGLHFALVCTGQAALALSTPRGICQIIRKRLY